MTPEREEKFKKAIKRRQSNLTVILENVHDPHNVGAVLRTCDSVGVKEVFVLYSEKKLDRERLELGKRSSSGARKWVDVHFYTDVKACFTEVKERYDKIYSTHLDQNAVDLYELDMTQSVALLFGNEKDGLSEAALKYSDGNFLIPQMGLVQSLNISVACAVTLYEAYRQRKNKGFYNENLVMSEADQQAMFEVFAERQKLKIDPEFALRKNDEIGMMGDE